MNSSYTFIVLSIYAGYKLIRGGYVSVTLPPSVTGGTVSLGSRILAFLKIVF